VVYYFKKIKKLQTCKPDSVEGYHLSVPKVTCRNQSAYPSTLPVFRQTSNEPFFKADLCGISACKVYPLLMLPSTAVSSYLTFSPSPRPSPKEREKAVIFCGTVCSAIVGVSANNLRPGYSPVHCSVLSGLSFPINRDDNPVCS
jgi:hypothetical protein